jgi:transglutaminase-like putative cysteine protease
VKLFVQAALDYTFAQPADVLLQIEAAALPDQLISAAHIDISQSAHVARVAGHERIGERFWLHVADRLTVNYFATVEVQRAASDVRNLPETPPHLLPSSAVDYLMPSRYCQSDLFGQFVESEFAGLNGGARVMAIHDWVHNAFSYVPGVSSSATTALESFVRREGICRDYAHVMIALVRACGIPARIVSVYALGVTPQDFHAVAEVFVGGEWHLIDATGMARDGAMAKIGVGRDAADVSFLTAYGYATLQAMSVSVTAG